jgi:hypothetical protein
MPFVNSKTRWFEAVLELGREGGGVRSLLQMSNIARSRETVPLRPLPVRGRGGGMNV